MGLKKILVADDEEQISAYLHRKLSKLGYEVYVAGDGEEALNLAFSRLPDIVLLDVKMPKMSGIEVCKRLRSDDRTRTTPIILLSAKAQSDEVQAGLDAGADKYLCKPMGFPDILRQIREYEEIQGRL